MNKIDIKDWKEFLLIDLFHIVLSKGDIQAKKMSDGKIPLVSSGKFNNGICKYIANGDGKAEIFDANIITIDMFGKSYYQAHPFYAVSHGRVNMLLPRFKLSRETAMFIVSVIDASFSKKYTFSGMCNQKELQKEHITLPTTSTGMPDWQYMENYIKKIEKVLSKQICDYKTINYEKCTYKSKDWKEFRIDTIFNIVKGKRLTKADMKEGNINFIGASAINNGVTIKIGNTEHLHPASTLTVSYNGSVGETFYQTEPFWASDDVNVLYPKFEINAYKALFLIPIIRKIGKQYAFVDKWKKENMEKDLIPLPVDSSGNPDFAYMENYMKTIVKKQRNNLDALRML